MKLVITGGHHTSALAVMGELEKIDRNIEFYFVGHKFSMEGDLNPSAEYNDINALKIPFYDIAAARFYGPVSIARYLKILVSVFRAYRLLRELKPDCILSFGGYLAVPVVIAGRFLKIISVTHEQTVVAGLANKLIARFANHVFVSWPQSIKSFPKGKVKVTGLPLRKELFEPETDVFSFEENLPVVYITGGKQGSHLINESIKVILESLLLKANVIHQCGNVSFHNDLGNLKEIKKSLSSDLSKRYTVVDYISSAYIGEIFAKSSIVVSRAGAHSVYELMALKKPAILIPIWRTSQNEQIMNAKFFKESGLGEVLQETELSPQLLLNTIEHMLNNPNEYTLKQDDKYKVKKDSAFLIAHEVYKLAENKQV